MRQCYMFIRIVTYLTKLYIDLWLFLFGWVKIHKIRTTEKIDSFLNGSRVPGIKRSHYAHQVILSTLV